MALLKVAKCRSHLLSALGWINEIPTVPIYFLARERAWNTQRGKKALKAKAAMQAMQADEGQGGHAGDESQSCHAINGGDAGQGGHAGDESR